MARLDPSLRGTVVVRRALVALLSVLLPAAAAAAPTAAVWVASSTEKILPGEPARPDAVARISAARNEFEAFQVVVTGSARGVQANASVLTGPGGATLAAPAVYAERFISLRRASAPDGGTGRWPDALVPAVDELVGEERNAFPFDIRRGESHAIWVEAFVPADAVPGLYKGSVTVSIAGRTAAVVPVELTVWNFALPSTASLRSAFGLMWGALPSGHGFPDWEIPTFATLRARYGQLALDHRVTLSRHDDGVWNDFVHFDTYYRPLVDGTAPTRLAGARLTSVEYLGGLEDVASLRRWATHYRSRGWFDRLFQYTCDEPPQTCAWDDIRRRAAAAKAADPEFRTLVTTTIWDAEAGGVAKEQTGESIIDIIVPVVNFIDDKPGSPIAGSQRRRYDAFLARPEPPPNELWMYQSCMSHGCGGADTGWPSYMIDATAVRNRAMQWLLFRYATSGELYWETAFAFMGGDAWTDQWDFTGNGDGTLFYPGTPAKIGGTTHVPVASIRLKMIREGMEDYEYLKLLSDLGDPAFAEAEAAQLFPHPYSTGDVSAARLLAARERIARRILELAPAAAR
jgi:Glycoside hydrolase 123, catalytic domain